MSSSNEGTSKDPKFLNKMSDTSLWIASVRRQAIARAYTPDVCSGVSKSIKETNHTSGSTSGVVEARFLSSFGRICFRVPVETIYYNKEDGCILDGSGSNILDANK
jgi:hypothetical protein